MKKWMWLLIISMLVLPLAACGGADPSADSAAEAALPGDGSNTGATLSEEFEDAASLRSQLALGTLRLEGTPRAVTAAEHLGRRGRLPERPVGRCPGRCGVEVGWQPRRQHQRGRRREHAE